MGKDMCPLSLGLIVSLAVISTFDNYYSVVIYCTKYIGAIRMLAGYLLQCDRLIASLPIYCS